MEGYSKKINNNITQQHHNCSSTKPGLCFRLGEHEEERAACVNYLTTAPNLHGHASLLNSGDAVACGCTVP